jgi:histidyl-tRNA synthetase
MEGAPLLLERIAADDAEHFAEVRAMLDAAGVPYEVDGTLVRGLDYYTRTVFEFTSDALGAQSGVGGGGRYDLLSEQLGGPHVPGVGWAAGVERILLAASESPGAVPGLDVYISYEGDADRALMFKLLRDLRAGGLRAQMEQAGRSIKGQLKQANRLGAAKVIIVTPDELRVRDMESGDMQAVGSADEARALVS